MVDLGELLSKHHANDGAGGCAHCPPSRNRRGGGDLALNLCAYHCLMYSVPERGYSHQGEDAVGYSRWLGDPAHETIPNIKLQGDFHYF